MSGNFEDLLITFCNSSGLQLEGLFDGEAYILHIRILLLPP